MSFSYGGLLFNGGAAPKPPPLRRAKPVLASSLRCGPRACAVAASHRAAMLRRALPVLASLLRCGTRACVVAASHRAATGIARSCFLALLCAAKCFWGGFLFVQYLPWFAVNCNRTNVHAVLVGFAAKFDKKTTMYIE